MILELGLLAAAYFLLVKDPSPKTAAGAEGWVFTNPKTGLAEIHPTKKRTVLEWLGAYNAAPVAPDAETQEFGGAKAVLGPSGAPAIGAVQNAATKNQRVLIAVGPLTGGGRGPGNIWIGPPSIERAAKPGSPWAVLLGGLSS